MDKADRYQKILDFINGRLSPTEAESFQTEIDGDRDLAEQVAFHRVEREMMNRMLDQRLESEMNRWEKEVPPSPPDRRIWWWFGSVLFAALLFFLWPSEPSQNDTKDILQQETKDRTSDPANEPPVDEEDIKKDNEQKKEKFKNQDETPVKPEPTKGQVVAWIDELSIPPGYITVQTRGDSSLFSKASEAFNDGDKQGAIRLFEQVPAEAQLFVAAQYNLAHLYFEDGQYSKSLDAFQKLSENPNLDNPAEAQWMKILCMLGLRQFSDLSPILDELANDNEFKHQDKAKILKQHLE